MMTRIGFMNAGKIDAVLVMFSQQGFIIGRCNVIQTALFIICRQGWLVSRKWNQGF